MTTPNTEARRIEYVPLDELAVDPKNPKAHDTGTITASIDRFGVVEAIVRDERTGFIVSGHGRYKTLTAMQERGDAPPDGVRADAGRWLVPVVVGWASRSDAEAHAALIALNRTTELGGWVDGELIDLLGELAEQPDGLAGVGFYPDDIDQLQLRLGEINNDDIADAFDKIPEDEEQGQYSVTLLFDDADDRDVVNDVIARARATGQRAGAAVADACRAHRG